MDFKPPIANFDEQPFIVIWETTQACDLACVHCRACAQPLRDLLELKTKHAKKLIDDIADLKAPVFVMTGGDPLKRPDIFELVSYCPRQECPRLADTERHSAAYQGSYPAPERRRPRPPRHLARRLDRRGRTTNSAR